MKIKNVVSLQYLLLIVLILSSCGEQQKTSKQEYISSDSSGARLDSVPLIAVAQYVYHPALDSCREAFYRELGKLGYRENVTVRFKYFNANNDPMLANEIATDIVKLNPDVIYSLGTTISQSLKKETKDSRSPLVVGAITDPISAGLVSNLDNPGEYITGSSDQWPYFEQLELYKEIFPTHTTLGVLYNPNEDNTRYAMERTRVAADSLSIRLIEVGVSNIGELSEATTSLVSRCQAIYIPADNTAMAGASAITKVAKRYSVPVIAGDPETFKQGCVIGLGVSYTILGEANANQVVRILGGESPGSIPVYISSEGKSMINIGIAKQLGLNITQYQLDKFDVIE